MVADGITVTAAPTSVTCGEKAAVQVSLADAAGQPVSDHTLVEAATNFGGVLAGTGAIAGQQGLVSPVSSTVAETFGGTTTFYLLTSATHEGSYEVVVTTGGAGYLTGTHRQRLHGLQRSSGWLPQPASVSVQVTVNCSAPATPVPPTIVAPNTGGGGVITPPNTGDAGLAASNTSGGVNFFVVAGAFALAVATLGIISPKFLFRKE